MRSLSIVILSLFTLSLTACFGGGGNSTPNGARTKEEALEKLSPEHRKNFDTWKNKIIKTCAASDAFVLTKEGNTAQYGIDAAVLIKNNNNSVVFANAHKNLAVLTGYSSFPGVEQTKYEQSIEVNGRGYLLSAETKREGSNCSIYLFGQKVYETVIVESFNVGIHYSPNKQVTTTSQIPVIKNLGINGAAELVQHGLYSLLSASLKPSIEAQIFIGQQLGLSDDQAARLIKLDNNINANLLVRISGDPSAVWSNSTESNLIAQGAKLKQYFDGTSRTLGLEVRLPLAQFDFKGTRNSYDNGNISLILTSTVDRKDNNSFFYSLKNMEFNGLITFDENEASQCLKDRISAYLGSYARNNKISPSIEVLFSPCRAIFPEIEDVSYTNGFLKSLIPVVFASVNPSAELQYGGWDDVIAFFTKEAISQNKI